MTKRERLSKMNDDYIRRQDVMDLWNKYRFTIAVDAIEYGMQLKRLLAADVVQVVHAEWITDKYGNIVCSKCNWLAPQVMSGCLASRHLDYHKSEYCWHCGAKMDARGEE